MVKRKEDGRFYLTMYPEFLKWINECPICHQQGYKPEMPEDIGREYSVAGNNIRRYFNVLEVDELGLCMQCSRAYNRTQ